MTVLQKRQATVIDTILRYIIKTCQSGIVFTAFDDLFQRWLERMDAVQNIREVSTLGNHGNPRLTPKAADTVSTSFILSRI